jgi:hypothetical protein
MSSARRQSVADVPILHEQDRWGRPDVVLHGKLEVILNVDFC